MATKLANTIQDERRAPNDLISAAVPSPWRETLLLFGLALVLEVCFLWGFVLPYFLPQYFATPLLDLAKINHATPESFNYFAVTWIISFFAFMLAWNRCPSRPARGYLLVLGGAALVFNLTLLFMYPTGAADLLDYIVRARQLAHYGDNPWVHVPLEAKYQGDPLWPYIGGWSNTTSPYGPMWEIPAAAMSWLAGADLWRNLMLFKGLVIVAYGVSCILVYAILNRIKPDWAARGLLFFAWNPLLLWETAGNGHNDMLMITFLLLACYLATFRDWRLLAAPAALALAALVKFIPILFLPALLIVIWRGGGEDDREEGWIMRGITRVLIGLMTFFFTAALVYAPFWNGPDTIGALWRGNLFTASIPTVIKDYLVTQLGVAEAQAMATVRTTALALTVLWVGLQSLWLFLPGAGDGEHGLVRRFYRACYLIVFFYLIFGTLWFQPWYQLWLIALTPLPVMRDYAPRTVAVNAGGVANYFVWDYIVLWNISWGPIIQWTSALTVNLPPLLYTTYQLLARRPLAKGDDLDSLSEQLPLLTRPVRQQAANPASAASPSLLRRSKSAHE